MKKKILSLVLALLMVLGTVPAAALTAFAVGSPAGNLAKLLENLNTENAATVYFGGTAFRVIGDENGGVTAPAGALTLISSGVFGNGQFNPFSKKNSNYSGSALQSAINGSVTLTSLETAAVLPRTLEGGKGSGDDCDGVAGSTVENAILWALTTKNANELDSALRTAEGNALWWLCSSGTNGNSAL